VARKGIQLCYPLEERRILSWSPPFICQPKLDGERCRAILNPSEPYPASVTLLSSEENVFQSVPHLIEPLHKLAALTGPIELDGELYVKGMSFEQVHSIVGRTVNLSTQHEAMELHLFDVVNENLPQWERTRILARVKSLCSSPEIQFVQTVLVETLEEVLKAYDRFVEDGYEGIIVRHVDATYVRRRSLHVLKFKPKKEDIYHIVGFTQMLDKNGFPKPILGSLECVSNLGESTFNVGSGMTDSFRHDWWPAEKAQELVGKMLRVKYQSMTEKKIPRFPIFVEIVEPIINPFL
jgi:ATP-dependent DNA ligase